jgi:NAD-dependent SIR2 family protein deacetylase
VQFVRNGPDIPERLLQAHEDGRVVFFCGAGISCPAGLPLFSGLVDQLFGAVGDLPNAVQRAAIKSGEFDTAIGLLEAGTAGGRERVRQALVDILTPANTSPRATATHEALLTLGRTRSGRYRLVTTNFDRLFEHVKGSKSLDISCYQAPLLPIPKERWNGLVYLHGMLSTAPNTDELHRLVLSSATTPSASWATASAIRCCAT